MKKLKELIKDVEDRQRDIKSVENAVEYSLFKISYKQGYGSLVLTHGESEKVKQTLITIAEDRRKALEAPKGKLDALNELLTH